MNSSDTIINLAYPHYPKPTGEEKLWYNRGGVMLLRPFMGRLNAYDVSYSIKQVLVRYQVDMRLAMRLDFPVLMAIMDTARPHTIAVMPEDEALFCIRNYPNVKAL